MTIDNFPPRRIAHRMACACAPLCFISAFALLGMLPMAYAKEPIPLDRLPERTPRNVIFILVDDHRFDAMSYMGHPFLETPRLDALARGGVHFGSAFVTTSLCSPSRASILTGQYMHHHGVVDNNRMTLPGTVFFPQYLQQIGYDTAFIGKWHMGGVSDAPRPGFDHWVSFRGQGYYYPTQARRKRPWRFNVDGQHVPQRGYITDELTDYALDWLEQRKGDRPFFLYLSHKAVHGMFHPAKRHAGRYKGKKLPVPATMADTLDNRRNKPRWLLDQRNSWHGVEYAYHQKTDIEEHYRLYCESLLAVDESVGRVMDYLKERGWYDDTLVLYMGDNGFQWGEHGLIDKRTAYEASMRVPLIAHCPALFAKGTVINQVVANIDIGPTVLEAAGVATPQAMDGRSFLRLASGDRSADRWRKALLYEYYWEFNFPHTPTTFALRSERYKFIQYHGIWDLDEFYDVKEDPGEQHNLIFDPDYKQLVTEYRKDLNKRLVTAKANHVPFNSKRGLGAHYRRKSGSRAADFSEEFYRDE